MVKEMIDGIYRQTNLQNEAAEYLSKGEDARPGVSEPRAVATGSRGY